MQTGKYRSYTIERLVNIMLIDRVSIINMASGIYLKDKHLEYFVHYLYGIKSQTERSSTYVGETWLDHAIKNSVGIT